MISPWQIAFEQNEIIPVCFQLLKIYRNDFDFLKSYRYDFNVLYSKIFSKSYRYDFKKLKSFRYIFNFRNRTEKPFNMTSLLWKPQGKPSPGSTLLSSEDFINVWFVMNENTPLFAYLIQSLYSYIHV